MQTCSRCVPEGLFNAKGRPTVPPLPSALSRGCGLSFRVRDSALASTEAAAKEAQPQSSAAGLRAALTGSHPN